MLQILASLAIALFFYWLISKMMKAVMAEKVEEIEIKIGSLESRIDELYTIIYKLGNTVEIICLTKLEKEKKPQEKPVSPGALKMREYRAKKKGSPSRSEKMKAYWEKRREENIKASDSSVEKQLQSLLADSK